MSEKHKLSVLSSRRDELETCAYCPRLCRTRCPVSNQEPRESLTPWGKMTLGWLGARGEISPDRDVAGTAWACTDCGACTDDCRHKNPVGATLTELRAEHMAAGLAPAAVERMRAGFCEAGQRRIQRVLALSKRLGLRDNAPRRLLVGCGNLRGEGVVDIVRVVNQLDGPVSLSTECCGLPQRLAGDQAGYERALQRVAAEAHTSKLYVADPGCARALGGIPHELVIDLMDQNLERFRPLRDATSRRLRFHDPCQLGRGLGRYDEPRRLLARLLGAAPLEFDAHRERAVCSGGGGLLPAAWPEVASGIASSRVDEHKRLGGGTIVTACASSLRQFRAAGAEAVDLTVLASSALGI